MEKIVVLTSSTGDENLIDCLKTLFPECTVEVQKKRPKIEKKKCIAMYAEDDRRVN
jgi:hypothetical protein